MNEAFNIDLQWAGIILVAVLALIIFGGVKRITHVAEFVVPFMAVAYILVALAVIGLNIEKVPEVFSLIIKSAFSIDATFGGIFGAAISWGVKRGIYSNEAGQGTGPHAAAAAEVDHPAQQGLVQAFSVYIDTLFICTATAFMILVTQSYNVMDGNTMLVENLQGVSAGPIFTQQAVESTFSGFGSTFVAISLLFFAFTTIMAYYYIAETNVAYLTQTVDSKWPIIGLRCLLLFSVFYGTIKTADVAWGLGDLGVGLMAWLNIVAILLLRKPALRALKDFESQQAKGEKPHFDAKDFGIEDPDNIWTSK